MIEDRYTARALQLIRVGNGWARDADRDIADLGRAVLALAAAESLGTMSRRRRNELIAEIDALVVAAVSAIAARQVANSRELVEIEAQWARISKDATQATLGAEVLILGLPIRTTWDRLAATTTARLHGVIREAVAGVADPATVPSSIRDAIRAARQFGEAVSHSVVTASADVGHNAAWAAAGVTVMRWHAVLDAGTTVGCAIRHGKLYDRITDKPIGHTIPIERRPPRHYRCRSILIPVIFDEKIPQPEDGGASTFDAYFRKLSADDAAEQFGKGRAALFRSGRITQRDLVAQNGRTLTLAELRGRL